MGDRGIFVEITIKADIERVWELTQNTELHPRWDLRFSRITPVAELPSGGYRFAYARRLPGHTILGTGTSIGESARPDGTRTSALRFTTDDRMSPLGDGRGYWRYVPGPGPGETTFTTGYDYEPGWGRMLDRLVMRRLIGWMTAWSFDRLRIWAETGIEPERWPPASVLAFWRPDRPRASRCRREPARSSPRSPGSTPGSTPRRPHALADAPSTLDTLEAP